MKVMDNIDYPPSIVGVTVSLFNMAMVTISYLDVAEQGFRVGGTAIGCVVGLVTIYWYVLKIRNERKNIKE